MKKQDRDSKISDTLCRLHRWCDLGGSQIRESSIQDLLYYDLFQHALEYPSKHIDREPTIGNKRFDIRLKPNRSQPSSHFVIEIKKPSLDILGRNQEKYIRQAAGYVLANKAWTGCVTNGNDWLFFRRVKRYRCKTQYDAEIIFSLNLGKDNSSERIILQHVLARFHRKYLAGMRDLLISLANLQEDLLTKIKHNNRPADWFDELNRRMKLRKSDSSVRYKSDDIEAIELAFRNGATIFNRMTDQTFTRIPIDA